MKVFLMNNYLEKKLFYKKQKLMRMMMKITININQKIRNKYSTHNLIYSKLLIKYNKQKKKIECFNKQMNS